MKKPKSILRIAIINLALIGLSLLSAELIFRVKLQVRLNSSQPLSSIKNIASALLNRRSDWGHLNQSNILRKPHPYSMFKGAPNEADHNHLGYRIHGTVDKKTINIALFGGSTGYLGTPPIIHLVTHELNASKKRPAYSPLNFSIVSSNHNQHVHALVENYTKYPIDIIIFYGGYNETLQTAFYDTRPGFPYNFRVRNEMSPEEMLLRKHLALYLLIDRIFERTSLKPFTDSWSLAIVENYRQTIETARLLSKSLATGRCRKSFLFIYQPYQMSQKFGIPISYHDNVHKKLKDYTISASDGIDISESLHEDSPYYTDIVHLTQEGNQFIAREILGSSIFRNAIQSCANYIYK